MSEYTGAFDKEFIIRTKEILEKYDEKYEVTLLINCTLSLICMPIEKIKYSSNGSPNLEIVDILSNQLQKFLVKCNTNNNLALLKTLRNGIAHLDIKLINKKNCINNITITGSTKISKNTSVENIFSFKSTELKEFAIFMANEYLKLSK